MPKQNKKNIELPVFDLQKWIDHIQGIVDNAPNNVAGLVFDLFCGAGGVSEGLLQATDKDGNKLFAIIGGINHDIGAIFSQSVNHPHAWYSCEDIKLANLQYAQYLASVCRRLWPQCPLFIWASLECTNLSNAKGGMSRNADSRSLADHMPRYLTALKPDGLWIENVREFLEWGPLIEKTVLKKSGQADLTINEPFTDEQSCMDFYNEKIAQGYTCECPLSRIKEGKKTIGWGMTSIPIKSLKGTLFQPWHEMIQTRFKLKTSHAVLNCADFGVPQNRKRLFLIYQRNGLPITFPKPTHAKIGSKSHSTGLKAHVPVKTCLDFTLESRSIFEEGFIKAENTYKRVYAGLIKFVAGGKKQHEQFVMQSNGGEPEHKVYSLDNSARTITTTGNQYLVKAYFLHKSFSAKNNTDVNAGADINDAAPAISTQGRLDLVQTEFLTKYMGNNQKSGINNGSDINEPSPVVTTQNRLGLVKVDFIDVVYGNGSPSSIDEAACSVRTKDGQNLVTAEFLTNTQGQSTAMSLENASPTVMTKDKLNLVEVKYFLTRKYSSGTPYADINNAADTVVTMPNDKLVEVLPFIEGSHFDNTGSSINDAAPAITANRKYPYLVTPETDFLFFNQYGGQHSSIDNASPTIIARTDKAAPYLISTDQGEVLIPVFKSDTATIIKIKEFMALYGIADIKMRMLVIPELLAIQSFPPDYFLAGSKTDQKKYIGNAVPPRMAKKLGESLYNGMLPVILKKFKTINQNQRKAA